MMVPRHSKDTQCHALLSAPVQWAGWGLSTGTGPSAVPAIIIYNSVEIITVSIYSGAAEILRVVLGTTS